MEENVTNTYQHAAVHPDARIGKNVKIGPWVTIEADVVIGDNTTISANVCIMSGTRIGKKLSDISRGYRWCYTTRLKI
jgi:UDP-N-acetylglucosamine acyltransferase